MAGGTKYIGVPRKRSEDPMMLMGQAKYVDDITLLAGVSDTVWLHRPELDTGIPSDLE